MNNNIDTLIKDFVAFERKNKSHDGHYHFNLLEEQQGHIVENSHSNILIKLLQYRDAHGWVFLESFLSRLDLPIQLNNDEIVFKREHNRIDIFIYSKSRFAIIIENKANRATSRSNQISDYIDKTLKDNDVFDYTQQKQDRRNKTWIIYLDRDGNTEPDKNSKARLEKDFKDRYKAANYLMHILPWLEEDVLPIINYKDKELLAGVIQYIDYLKGIFFLGLNSNHKERIKESVEWLKQELSSELKEDFYKQNKKLHQIYLKVLRKKTNNSFIDRERTTFLNALFTLSEEPLQVFIDTTKSYFNNFNECNFIHHFTFYYYYITPKQWTGKKLRVSFGWETMGMKALAKSKKYIFGIVVSGPQDLREDFENCFGQKLKEMKYNKNKDITRLLNYRVEIITKKSFLEMDDERLRKVLLDTYEKYVSKELMSSIQDRFFK